MFKCLSGQLCQNSLLLCVFLNLQTTLNYTWGTKALKPLDTVISVPHLSPNEIDTVSVRLQIPGELSNNVKMKKRVLKKCF